MPRQKSFGKKKSSNPFSESISKLSRMTRSLVSNSNQNEFFEQPDGEPKELDFYHD